MAGLALIITLPALIGDEANFTYAFAAVVSIAVIGLYIAYVIPIVPALADGRRLRAGAVDPRQEVQVDQPARGVWVIICVIIFSLPQRPPACHGTTPSTAKYVNYAPVTVLVVIIAVGLWWLISAQEHVRGADPPGRDRRHRPGSRRGHEPDASART